ncbi:MAG TPA: polysaccharide biosynthesis tyrosine autokinase [Thermoanaerobaculia bacterium]|jgi:capsular exopolysaccharide synthesis family protein
MHARAGPDNVYYELAPEAPGPAPEGDAFDVAKYLHGLRRRWPLVVVCCLLAGTFALIRYSLTPKEYQATTIIQIERKRLSLLTLGQAGWLEDWWNMEYYPTQYRLLKSRGMAERVVMNLRLHEDPNMTGRPAGRLTPQGETAVTSSDDAAELADLANRVKGGLTVNPIAETQLVELTFRSTSPELASRVANGYAEAFIQWGIETRNTTVGQASSTLSAQIESLRQEIEELQQQQNKFAYDAGDTLDPAGEALIERRRTLETQSNRVIAERISKEVAYKQLLDLSDEMIANTASGGRVNQLQDELFQLESEYREKLETYRPEWPDMVSLRGRIEEKREAVARLVRETVNQIRDQAYADYQKARQEEDRIAAELRNLAEEGRQSNSSALQYNNLLTLINTRKELLSELLKRQSQTEVAFRAQTGQESNARVIDSAVVPNAPFRPSLRRDLSQALLLGLLLGLGGVVLLEYLDRTIKTPEELESLLGLPNLAVIPDIDEARRGAGGRARYGNQRGYGYNYNYAYGYGAPRQGRKASRKSGGGKAASGGEQAQQIELLPFLDSRLAICEAYRSLRTALLLSSAHTLKLVAVTSAMPGEGKTATTVNLGVVLAQLNRRVLLIDGDLRRARMHKVLEVSNRFGLVNYLTGQIELERVFLETRVANLWVCPAGPTPPNPSELLASDRMAECFTNARQRFDIIVIDTPPVLPVADAVILGSQVDGVILCARAGMLLREDARACRERLKYEEIRILGTVLNRYRARAGSYDKSYKYYGAYEETPAPAEPRSSAA